MIREGFEPSTHSLEGCCSIQLSYRTMFLRVPLMMNTRRCHYQLRPNLRPGFYFFPPHCVPWAGLEPARVKHWFLRPACLPFHHLGIFLSYMSKNICVLLVRGFPCTAYRNRTGTNITVRGILSPLCLPISPRRHFFIEVNIR